MLSRLPLEIPKGDVRPTTDRVRESVFAIIGPIIQGARVLDLFAGSGALGLEAASRGALAVTWVEQDRLAYDVLCRNVQSLCRQLEIRTECLRREVHRFLDTEASVKAPWEIIIADPPYEANPGTGQRVEQIMSSVTKGPLLVPGGILVYEMPAGCSPPACERWRLLREKKFGRTRIAILALD